jgi:hypothetical protein
VGEVEAGAACGQAIEVWRQRAATVTTECIGAQRVDRDQEHVAIRNRQQREGRCTKRPPRDCSTECDDRRKRRHDGAPARLLLSHPLLFADLA